MNKEKLDFKKIEKYIEHNKKKKPGFVAVDDKEWETALLGYEEVISESVDENTTTEQAWTLIYFCAVAFCKGMERAEVKAGTRQESNYPRY